MTLDAVFVDVETGGLDPTAHSLLGVGAVFIKNDEIVDRVEWLIKTPTYRVTPGALAVNNINLVTHDRTAQLASTVSSQLIGKVEELYGVGAKPMLGAHNLQFDHGFLRHGLGMDVVERFSHRGIDTCSIATFLSDVGILPKGCTSSSKLVEYLGIKMDGERHTALADALMAWDIYRQLIKMVKEFTND